ncbi:MAG TPA: hypothetical protein DDW21_01330 [Verrucomicrobiales bacterium]|jgi:hypothetical protein|nr:MAG: hypothetical protein B9S37_00445 [Verrucomicrobiae bacterium Tous-C3TDCM]PAZ07346.1 MAG: hypothetical protein CAK88_01175 [Verrucomicrobiae bacterium AMD-G2]HBE22107.1 hypothetical protein [Verrucomicrobiales bacterium]
MTSLRPLSEMELAEWEEAYISVECYLRALQLRNRLLVADMVRAILFRASDRQAHEPQKAPRVLAMEETLKAVADWTSNVLNVELQNNRLAARGRLALLLADMPGKWQPVFLTQSPWPEPFVQKMRSSYLAAGPQFAALTMTPQPLELNALGSGAAQWFGMMERRPLMKKLYYTGILATIATMVWLMWKG